MNKVNDVKNKNKELKIEMGSTVTGSVLNLGLALLKLYIGIVTGSVVIFFDAVNNFLDIFSNVLGCFGVYFSLKKPNKDYPNGYGRLEYIISFVISAVSIIMGVIFVIYSIERIVYPLPIRFTWLYFWLLVSTVIIKFIMGIGYYIVYNKYRSRVLKALYFDSFMDSAITACTVLCYALVGVTTTVVDAWFGLAIGIAIMALAFMNTKKNVLTMLGYNPDIDIDEITEDLIDNGCFSSIESVKLNDYGRYNRNLMIDGKIKNSYLLSDMEKKYQIKIYIVERINNE